MQIFPKDNYRYFFLAEYLRRNQRNPNYSWRAFARDLNITSSRITEIMKGQAGISLEKAKVFAPHLHLSLEEQDLFFDLVEMEHGRNKLLRQLAKERFLQRQPIKDVFSDQQFSLIAKWYYLALLSLLELPLPDHSPESIGHLLGVDTNDIREALKKLEEMNLIEMKSDRYSVVTTTATTAHGTPSTHRREFHRQLLEKALDALDHQALEERSMTAAVMALDKSQMELAQKRIRQFRIDLMKELESCPSKNAVYCLSLNFFALTRSLER